MNIYLLKWTCNDKSAYKIGISKSHSRLMQERFGRNSKFWHPGYGLFDIEEIGHIYISSDIYLHARIAAFGVEHAMRAVCPKDFNLEEYFGLEPGVLDGMGGITEFFLMPEYFTEEQLIGIFNQANNNAWQLNNKLKSLRGTVAADMEIMS